mmetsp:Transcript_10310/g.15341  ORF Transcript_10310/g.15341 Transcript_10310/m.15341 type:complete len:255 (-) Transcript_10310:841-1605(-)
MNLRHLNETSLESLIGNITLDHKDSQTSFFSFISSNYGAFVGSVFALLVFLTFVTCLLNEYFRKKYGFDLFRGQRLRTIARRAEAALERRRIAQRATEMGEVDREIKKVEKRRARLERFRSMLKSTTMTIQEENLRFLEGRELDEDRLLVLPMPGQDGKSRTVPAMCPICLCKYEADDVVIQSTNTDCQHCYHDECILMWLSTGKIHCPSCRQIFTKSVKNEFKTAKQTGDTEICERNEPVGEDNVLNEVDEEE